MRGTQQHVISAGLPLTPLGGELTRRGLLLGGAGAASALLLAPDVAQAATRSSLDRALRARLGSHVSQAAVSVYDRRSRQIFDLNPTWTNECASIVKVLILVTLLRSRRRAGQGLSASDRSLATSMIRYSDNNAASALMARAGGIRAVQSMARDLGMRSTTTAPSGAWGLTRTTSRDQLLLLRHLGWGSSTITSSEAAYVRGLMATVTPSQRFGVGQAASGATIMVKNGWLPRSTGAWRHNSIGFVTGGGRDYALAILTRGNSSDTAGRALTTDLARIVHAQLATPLR